MHRRLFILPMLAAATLGCGSSEESVGPATRETTSQPNPAATSVHTTSPEAPSATADTDESEEPFDFRRVRTEPGAHLEQNRICDLVFVGRLSPILPQDASRYSVPAQTRVSAKCRAETGDGWMDLLLLAQETGATATLLPGQRIEVKILAAGGGILNYPVTQFVEAKGDAPETESPELLTHVPTRFDFSRVASEDALIGSVQECACDFSGEIEILSDEARTQRHYDRAAQNRMTIRCRAAEASHYVDLTFTPDTASAALRVRRGAVFSVRITEASGGFADYPLALYAAGE